MVGTFPTLKHVLCLGSDQHFSTPCSQLLAYIMNLVYPTDTACMEGSDCAYINFRFLTIIVLKDYVSLYEFMNQLHSALLIVPLFKSIFITVPNPLEGAFG